MEALSSARLLLTSITDCSLLCAIVTASKTMALTPNFVIRIFTKIKIYERILGSP